ncbi:hypothetical protein [Thorsellia kenyensis]|uniref:Uncharacterized protein n=1 Tax=Thorsellia kenyensis TaxID=1549888 RepID=A0ABV6CD18_9GAMM
MIKVVATILLLLGILGYVQAKPIDCYDKSLSEECELTFNREANFENFYHQNLYVSATQQPFFKEKSIEGMRSGTILRKLGDKFIFQTWSSSVGIHSEHVLVMEYSENELTVVKSLYVWDEFNHDIKFNKVQNYGKECELNIKVNSDDYEEFSELFSNVKKICDELIKPYTAEIPNAYGNVFYIKSYENNKISLKKVFFPNKGNVLLELACIENCGTNTQRYFGEIDNKYPFILEYDLTAPKDKGEYYYLKFENEIPISGSQSNGGHTLYALGSHKIKTESFVLRSNQEG